MGPGHDPISVTINGEERRLQRATSVAELLDQLGIPLRHVAVERNRALVPKAEFDSTRLADGDVLEVVTLVGGG